jgi:hypothetical protein
MALMIARLVTPEYGGTNDQLIVKDGVAHAYRNRVTEPDITGLAAFRKVRRDCIARIQDIAGPTPIIRFDRMRLEYDPEVRRGLRTIYVFVQCIATHARLS